jgi:hypothetical protein
MELDYYVTEAQWLCFSDILEGWRWIRDINVDAHVAIWLGAIRIYMYGLYGVWLELDYLFASTLFILHSITSYIIAFRCCILEMPLFQYSLGLTMSMSLNKRLCMVGTWRT